MKRTLPGRKLTVTTALLTVAALFLGGLTWALWSANTEFSGGRISAGALELERGNGTWSQVTAGVSEPASGSIDTDTSGFVSMPGDVIEFTVPISTTLQGENLRAELLVEAGNAASRQLASGEITASYRVEDSRGDQVAPATGGAELGEPVTLAGLTSSNAGNTAQWTVAVTVNVNGEYHWTEQEPLLDLGSWTVDGIKVALHQVRGETIASERRGP